MERYQNEELLKLIHDDWRLKQPHFKVRCNYYRGKTKALNRLVDIDNDIKKVSNHMNINMIKKFIKEEIAYSLGNEITYQNTSTDNKDIVSTINYNLAHWSKKHNKELLKNALIFNEAYELYYIGEDGFSSKVLTPLNCAIYEDEYGKIQIAMHIYKKQFDDETLYFDVYTPEGVYLYKNMFEFIEFKEHYFGEVPISMCRLTIPEDDDTIFDDIHMIQDAYSINLSNASSELTEYRMAYLKIKKGQIEDDDIPKLKKLGILQGDFEDIDWLIKNINDTFIVNTLDRLKEDMFEICGHLPATEQISSNVSGVALRSRLISLENRCKLNQQSMHDCINNRLKLLFVYLNKLTNANYSWRNVNVKFTLSIPQDDYLSAQVISLLGDRISDETALEQLSFIVNGKLEKLKADNEKEPITIGEKLLDGVDADE